MGGLLLEVVEKIVRGFSELAPEGLHHQRIGERWYRGLGLGELARIGRGEQVLVDAKHLRELERPSLQLAEGIVDRLGILLVEFFAELAPALGILADDHGSAVVL